MRNYTDTEADLEYLPNRTAFREYAIPDADAIDDLVDSLWRHGSAQDYPLPEAIPPPRLHDPKPTCRREFVDSRSLYHDINLDDPPVPGYADFPNDIARKLNFGTAAMPSKSPKQARQADAKAKAKAKKASK